MLYFAYGSNMDWQQIRERCPSARFICVAELKDHRLAFTRESKNRGCGVADAVSEPGKNVWGVVYEMDEGDIHRLDKAEGFVPGRLDNAYNREDCQVYLDGDEEKPLTVSIYIAVKQDNPPLPNLEYKKLIVEGAKFWQLPPEYIKKLEQVEVGP